MDIKSENKPIAANKKRGNRCVFQEAKIQSTNKEKKIRR